MLDTAKHSVNLFARGIPVLLPYAPEDRGADRMAATGKRARDRKDEKESPISSRDRTKWLNGLGQWVPVPWPERPRFAVVVTEHNVHEDPYAQEQPLHWLKQGTFVRLIGADERGVFVETLTSDCGVSVVRWDMPTMRQFVGPWELVEIPSEQILALWECTSPPTVIKGPAPETDPAAVVRAQQKFWRARLIAAAKGEETDAGPVPYPG
jgi:hypothetical protein